MFSNIGTGLLALSALLPSLAYAQKAFAHVIVGNTAAAGYTNVQWESDIRLAASYGIDGFVLNVGTPYNGNSGQDSATQMSEAFIAANRLINDGILPNWRMFFMFDYTGGTAGAWPQSDVISALRSYQGNGAYFTVDGKMMVSTFEGVDNINDWPTIRNSISGGIYFVPDWTSKGPGGFDINIVDGAFNWDMWPEGPQDVNTVSDANWSNWLGSKSYMMGVSPWFYTDLTGYNKAWVWRGDKSWSLRWDQTHTILPDFIQIVTWNDYGESHYIGPIVENAIPTNASEYVDGYPHTGWLATLPYEIAAYKHAYNSANPAPTVSSSKIVYWYRTSPVSAGTTDATGNHCKSAINIYGYQTCYPITDILEDEVFAIVLASSAGTATITIGGSTSSYSVSAGKNFITKPFNGNTGTVSVSLGSISGSGVAITSQPASGVANYNAWVGCAGAC